MTLITIFLSLIAERFIGSLEDLRSFKWLGSFAAWFVQQIKGSSLFGGSVGVVLLLATLLVPVYLVFDWLHEEYALVGFALGLVVMIFCLGPRTFYDQAKEFCTAFTNGNTETATWFAEDITGRPLKEEEKQNLPRAVSEGLLVAANDRLFAVIFWFAIFGPIGALIYRFSSQLRLWANAETENEDLSRFRESLSRFYYLVGWVPAHLLAVSYAVAGNYVESMTLCRSGSGNVNERWCDENDRMLVCAGSGAIVHDDDEQVLTSTVVNTTRSLLRRTVVFWLAIVALLTIVGAADWNIG